MCKRHLPPGLAVFLMERPGKEHDHEKNACDFTGPVDLDLGRLRGMRWLINILIRKWTYLDLIERYIERCEEKPDFEYVLTLFDSDD